MARSDQKPKNILVRAPNWIGDQILAYPFYYFLRKSFPEAKITTVCVPWVSDIQFMDLIDDVFILERPEKKSLLARFQKVTQMGAKLKSQGPWDLGISLPNSFSAAWLLKKAGVVRRRGFKTEMRNFLLNDGLSWNSDPSRHRSQAYVDLLQGLGEVGSEPAHLFWGVPPQDENDPGIPGVLDEFAASRSWPHAQFAEPPQEPYWVLCPGSKAESRQWPIESYILLARQVAKQTGWKGVIVGGPGDVQLGIRLSEDDEANLIDYTACGEVSGLWKIFNGARFTLANESGLAHMASLCGSTVHIVCGAADPRRTKPIGPGLVDVSANPVECWPCERNTCFQEAEKKIQCLRGIKPDVVWEEIQQRLASQA